jgi:hypothetical protein
MVPSASGTVFMFCAPGLVNSGVECVGCYFHVLHARNYFRRYRGRWVQFSCFACPDSFSAVPSASGPVLILYVPRIIFDGTEGVGSRLNVLRSQTRFRRYRGRRVPFSCLAPRLIFGGTEGVGSRFQILCSLTRFQQYRWRQVPFSCLACPDSFSTVPRVSGPIFMFRACSHKSVL